MIYCDYPIERGAVLYSERERCVDHPELWHVMGVYEPRGPGYPYVKIQCGTHTEEYWHHIEDLRSMYTPAGFSVDTHKKPTYILTREYGNEAYPRDHMSPEVYE